MENMIDITGADLAECVKAAYDLSRPQGLGFLHHKAGSLTDEEAQAFVRDGSSCPVSLDYVNGRACKFTVFTKDGRNYIYDSWYDHSDADLAELLKRIGIQSPVAA